MVTRSQLHRRLRVLLGAVLTAAACNSLLENRPRELRPAVGGDASATSGPAGGEAGAPGSVSTTGDAAGASATGGAAGGGAAGAAGAEAPSTTTGNGTSVCTEAQPECLPGESEPAFRECACGGTQTRTKTCNDACTWALGAWGPCEGIECEPGAESAPEPCACDSARSRTRSCTESCTWGPPTSCELGCGNAPANLPATASYIDIWTTAVGRSGTSACCPEVGTSSTSSNPQFVWCRSWGGLVSDDRGNYNHWWLWTEFDDPAGVTGWMPAYYIDGQGNDQANGIPDCP
ncbi:MAG TPA: hypothetical protein VI197_04635 [Polyangiaceae bacterium]